MPRMFHGDWCADGGDCTNGVMTVTKRGFTGGGVTCDLKRVRYKHPNMWTMNFKCSDSDKPVEERWVLMGELLAVFFDLEDGHMRVVQYLPAFKRKVSANPLPLSERKPFVSVSAVTEFLSHLELAASALKRSLQTTLN